MQSGLLIMMGRRHKSFTGVELEDTCLSGWGCHTRSARLPGPCP